MDRAQDGGEKKHTSGGRRETHRICLIRINPSYCTRPQRTRTIPKRFNDYVLATTNETIPKDYDEAIACEDKKHWENAMLEEIQNMYSHQHTYQEALGMLMFLAVNTRPDIAYISSKLSQYSRQPKQMHWTAIKRVMRYIRGTIDLGVKFERGKTGILKSYTDASWSTTHDGKSYGGYVLKLGEATIDWKSSKQPLVALSTMEAEMIAACESCCQIKWIINLLRELEEWNFMEKPTVIYTDSQSLINWISSPKQSSRCRHINRKCHFLRDFYESRDICLLPSQDLEADIFTKDLSRDQMKKHLENLSTVGIKTKYILLSRTPPKSRIRKRAAKAAATGLSPQQLLVLSFSTSLVGPGHPPQVRWFDPRKGCLSLSWTLAVAKAKCGFRLHLETSQTPEVCLPPGNLLTHALAPALCDPFKMSFPLPEVFKCPECYGMAGVTRSGVYKNHNDLVKHLRVLHKITNVVFDCTVCKQSFKNLKTCRSAKHHQDCSAVETRPQKSAPSTRSKRKTPGSDAAALEESEHSTQPAAQEPTSSTTPTGPPVELDQQNAPPPASDLSAEATPFRPEAHGTSLATSETGQTTFVPPLPETAAEEDQRGTSSELDQQNAPPASDLTAEATPIRPEAHGTSLATSEAGQTTFVPPLPETAAEEDQRGTSSELDQQNAPPASDLSAEATPIRPEAHGTSLATSEAGQSPFAPPLPENAAEEDQRGTSSEEIRPTSPSASIPAQPSESPLVQQEEAADDLQLPVVHCDPPTVQTPQVLDSADLQAAALPDDPAPLPQDTPVTPPPASQQPVDDLQQSPHRKSLTPFQEEWDGKWAAAPDRETLFSLIESFVKGVKNETGKPDTRTRRRAPPPQKPRSTRPSAPSFDAEKAAKLQRSYNINKKRTMQEILGQRSPGCTIPIQMIEEHFEKRMVRDNTEFSPDPDLLKDFSPQDGAQLEDPISSNAVWYRLLKMGNTAPGPDGISYQELKRVDPNSTILTQIFQACFQMRAVPPSWKESSSILLHKKGDAEDLGNWRPIALGNTIAKLYTAVLADRLRRWAATTGQLSKAQKGFMEFEGCLEHNFVVQSAIEETKRTSRQACFAWLDLENAFGSVPHEHIFNVLNAFGVPEKVIAVFRDLYTDSSTSIRTPLGTTSPIPFKRGVKQGCPGSPTLFNVAIEVIVRTLASMAKDHGVRLQGHYVSVLAYADDLLIMAKDKESLQALLDTTGDLAGKIGLHFKGPKCATLHLDCRKKRTTLPTTFCIQEQPISAMGEEDAYCHLGVPTGFNKTRNPEEAIKGIKEDTEKIHSSLLAPWQKIDATKTFIYPRLDFILRGSPIHKTAFREVDLLIKRLGKKWLGLPQRASNEVLYIPPSKGGAGMVPFGDRTDLAKIQHAFRLLTSPDSETSALAKSLLKRVAERKLGRPALEEDLAAYLSGKLDGDFARDGGDITSLWSDARNASRRLSKRIGVQWVHNPTLGDITIKLPNAGRTPKEISLPAVARGQIMARLRQALQDSYLKTLIKKPDQGKVYEVTCRNKSSNGFINSGRYMRFADWRFIHRARLNVLPLNGAKRFGPEDKRCRVCGQVDETLPHVLQHCRKHSAAVNKRHHNIVERLKKATRLQGRTRVNQRVPEVSSNLRPDIVVTEEERKKITIIDVAIPFENRLVAFKDARERKISKYTPLANELREKGWEVFLDAFLVGPLGGWDNENEKVLRALDISPRYSTVMRNIMCAETIKWSRDIYVLKRHPCGPDRFQRTPLLSQGLLEAMSPTYNRVVAV
ncbi:hypothetical protein LAZ67_2006243 [Cordylochernes scorpioides]|uniref:Reverse transcriptase domain-containing protein n=1 Tax=Cordylochernes scorpioides TaxID=51811 RepID=A0ABY6K550_9ARAC|nr:hypothetical protein LAZ67_2006243 [Cordylochernes scorpioides]